LFSLEGITGLVSPNPVKDILHLQLQTGQAQAIRVQVYDALAHALYSGKEAIAAGKNDLAVSTNAWAPGVYQVVITGSRGVVFQTKIIKTK